MDHNEIANGNRLIKDFMGGTVKVDQDDVKDIPLAFLKVGDLKFHVAWKWLMPVVLKIEEEEGHSVRIEGRSCSIKGEDDTYDSEADSKMEAIWKSVVAYLEAEK